MNIVWEDLPANVVLYNPVKKLKGGGSPIVDYPVSEQVVDQDGNPVLDRITDLPKMTGETIEWSLSVDSRKKFPKYVAIILKDRYDFLKVEVQSKTEMAIEEATKQKSEKIICPICPGEIPFGTQGALDGHMEQKHSDIEGDSDGD